MINKYKAMDEQSSESVCCLS